MNEWPKQRFQQGSMTDEEANILVVPADLARELYEAAKSYPRDKRLSDAIARYEREVKNE